VPFLYAVVEAERRPVVLVGVGLETARSLNTWWQVQGRWPKADDELLAGVRAAEALGLAPGEVVNVKYGDESRVLRVAGVLETGGPEDEQLVTGLHAVQSLTDQAGRVVLLGEIVSADDAQMAEQQERERARTERQAARSAGHNGQPDASMVVLARSGDPLQQARASRKAQAEQAISALLAFYASNPQATQAQASAAVERSRQWVGATLAQLEAKGRISRNGEGVMIVGESVLEEAQARATG